MILNLLYGKLYSAFKEASSFRIVDFRTFVIKYFWLIWLLRNKHFLKKSRKYIYMEIGILYIAIGKYVAFFNDFYKTCEKYFLVDTPKTYFVFTDQPFLEFRYKENVIICSQKNLGWPGNTLFRFDMFLSIEKEIIKFDYLFFFNGNTLFQERIDLLEILPNKSDSFLVGLSWLNVYTNKLKFPYERNINSTAYIAYEDGKYYYQGGLNGGRTKEYIQLMKYCSLNIHKDLEHGIIACNHDESHINKYFLDKKIKLLGLCYGCPEEWVEAKKSKIIFRDKNVVLGKKYIDKMKRRGFVKKIFSKIRTILKK